MIALRTTYFGHPNALLADRITLNPVSDTMLAVRRSTEKRKTRRRRTTRIKPPSARRINQGRSRRKSSGHATPNSEKTVLGAVI